MIAALRGQLLVREVDRVVVDVSGVGYEVMMAATTIAGLPETGNDVFLHIHTSVREDAITLFGFLGEAEKETFLALKTVSGIGPKLALAMLSGMRVEDLCRAIASGDSGVLTRLPGIGKKTAERICVDLKDRIDSLVGSKALEGAAALSPAIESIGSVEGDALSALTNLGYPESVSRASLSAVRKRLGDEAFDQLDVGALIREALRGLA